MTDSRYIANWLEIVILIIKPIRISNWSFMIDFRDVENNAFYFLLYFDYNRDSECKTSGNYIEIALSC